jgi:uncharacterized repeat protein (TIGR03806 family)
VGTWRMPLACRVHNHVNACVREPGRADWQSARSLASCPTLLLLLALSSCTHSVRPYASEPYPRRLSDWHLFNGRLADLKPNDRVIPYDLNSPLFSDYATKSRYVWMPRGTSATYRADDAFDFPTGTILAKTFAYDRLIETRLLVRGKNGWVGLPYVWDDAQTEARLQIAPDPVSVHYRGLTIDYVIPNTNQCKECHDKSKITGPIGPKARNLNKDYAYPEGRANQLAYWTRIGYLKGAPDPAQSPRAPVWDDPASGNLDTRARAYLDINCAHCHNPDGQANTSGLYLSSTERDPLRLGFCKVPVSAGQGSGDLRFDLVGGDPEESILVHRMDSVTPKVMMPELGRAVIHREGVALIRAWVQDQVSQCDRTGL